MQNAIYYKNKKLENSVGGDVTRKYCTLTYERMQECTENKADFTCSLSKKFASIL